MEPGGAGRGGDDGDRRGAGGLARARRFRRPDRRSRRGQDDLRPRPDPSPDRGARSRGAEPDLHPDAGLRYAARPGGPRRFLSAARPSRTRQSRLGRSDRRRDRHRRMAGAGRRSAARRPARSRDPFRPGQRPRFSSADAARQGRREPPAGAGPWGCEAPEARRLERRKARIPPGRRLDSRLRAAHADSPARRRS